MSKIFQVIEPKSVTDPNYADYEYLIRWVGSNGADYQLMFYDAEIERRVNSSIINEESDVEALVSSENKSVMLQADDLSSSDLAVVLQMFSNKSVTRLLTSGDTERYAPDLIGYKYRVMNGRYQIEFRLIGVNLAVWS